MKGFSQVKANLANVQKKILEAGSEGLKEVATTIYEDSKTNYVPIDTGALKNSAKMEEKSGASKYTIKISYNTTYAIYVHEIVYYYHAHGSWKYLETPFTIHTSKLEEIISEKIRGVL
jgi:hypothetical protein